MTEDEDGDEARSQRAENLKDARRKDRSPLGIKNGDVDGTAAGPTTTFSPKPGIDLLDGLQGPRSHQEEPAITAGSIIGTTSRPRSPTQDTTVKHLTIPNTTRRSKSPISLPPVTTNLDPQSPPTSANGAASHDTPAVTAESPDTSPGADEAPVLLQDFQKSKPSDDLTPPDSTDNGPTDSRPDDMSGDKTDAPGETAATEMDRANMPEPTEAPDKPTRDTDFKRPSVRIDTQSSIPSFGAQSRSNSTIVESPVQMTGVSTPRKTSTASYISQDQTKRATRISSGALERKSVSEILGDTPKVMSPQVDRSALMTPSSAARDEFMQATSAGRLAERDRRDKERERSKLSTVVFAKPPQLSDDAEPTELSQRSPSQGLGSPRERDYLYTLFESRAYNSRTGHTLNHLLGSAHKTLSTADHLVEYQEAMDCRTLKRIYQLQNANRWPLRQLKRAEEPLRPTSSWDFLLDHAKWLRTDFREERKWKMAAAAGVAAWCAEWVASSPEERKSLQVRVKPHKGPRDTGDEADETMHDEPGPAFETSQSPPELMPSGEDESVSDGGVADPRDLAMATEPAAIFSLGPNDFNFTFYKTPAAEKLLQELPLYQPAEIVPDLSKSDLAEKRDAIWKKDLCPISRFAEGKIKVRQIKPPSKRSRYDYDLENSPKDSTPLPPEQTNVALFMPENKHTRDRIHPGHSFRPPSEHPMPTQSFFECRTSSQWTQSEDDELRRLVKDYSYNWSLIASCLSPRSLFFSGADRRTPWECFERWTGLEGLPQEMQKTPYFRAYHGRIENAARHSAAQYEAAQRAAGNNQIPPRRRTTAPVRVERKRTQRYLAMLDGMRKLAKKRETAIQKQQHAADLAATRKMNEGNQPKPPVRTPAEFSQLKHEREIRSAERAEQYRQQLFAQRQFAAQQARQAAGQVNGVPNVPRVPGQVPNNVPGVNGMPNMHNGNMPGVPNGHVRPNTGLQPGPNNMGQMPPHVRGGAGGQPSPAQMQAQLALAQQRLAGQNHSPEQMRMQTEAIKAQQQQLLLARQAQVQQGVNGNHSSPNLPSAAMANGQGGQAAYMAALATANGMASPSVQMNGNGTSPRSNAANMGGGQPLSSGPIPVIQQLTAKIRAENPNLSGEEAQQLATQQMMNAQQNYQAQTQKRNQAALNAAMGAANAGQQAANAAAYAQAALNPQGQQPPMMSNEAVQAYNQRMRQTQQAMQAQQRQNMAAGLGPNGMMPNMTGSPIMNMARPVSQHSRSATPRERSGSHNGMNGPGQGSPRNGQIQMQS